MENRQIPSNDNDELHERLSNDSILEVIVTIFLIIVMVLIFVKFEFF